MDCPNIKIRHENIIYEVVDCNFNRHRDEYKYTLDQTVNIINPFNSFSTSTPIPEGKYLFVKIKPDGSWIKGIHRHDGLYIGIDSQKVDVAYSKLCEKLRTANSKIRELELDIELLKSTKEFIEACKSNSFT